MLGAGVTIRQKARYRQHQVAVGCQFSQMRISYYPREQVPLRCLSYRVPRDSIEHEVPLPVATIPCDCQMSVVAKRPYRISGSVGLELQFGDFVPTNRGSLE